MSKLLNGGPHRSRSAIGLIVVGLAVIFVTSQFGIFNLMQAFFTLLNIPVVVPVAFGLIFRRVPKWAAVGAITWGLIVGVTVRYGLDVGHRSAGLSCVREHLRDLRDVVVDRRALQAEQSRCWPLCRSA